MLQQDTIIMHLKNKNGLCWTNTRKRMNEMFQVVLTSEDMNLTIDQISLKAHVSRGTFFNYFEDLESFKIYFMNRFILDLYHENHDLESIDYIQAIIDAPGLCFASICMCAIEQKKDLIVLNEDDIKYYYKTIRTESYIDCLKKMLTKEFMIEYLNQI